MFKIVELMFCIFGSCLEDMELDSMFGLILWVESSLFGSNWYIWLVESGQRFESNVVVCKDVILG